MNLTVKVFALDAEARDVQVGSLVFDGSKIVPKPKAANHRTLLENMASEPISLPSGDTIYPEREPEVFMRNLRLVYTGAYLRAGAVY